MVEHSCHELRTLVMENENAAKKARSSIRERERKISEKQATLNPIGQKVQDCERNRRRLEDEIRALAAERTQLEFQKDATDNIDRKWEIAAKIDQINTSISNKRDAQYRLRSEQDNHEQEMRNVNDRIIEMRSENSQVSSKLGEYDSHAAFYRGTHSRQCPDDYLP